MQTFLFLPFWHEFGVIIGGTLLLFSLFLYLEKRIRDQGEEHGSSEPTPRQ